MKQRILENLTTTERLTLLEQIFAPGAGVRLEQSSCRLSDMDWMFDFKSISLAENGYSYDDIKSFFSELNALLFPLPTEPNYGLPFFIHVVLSANNDENHHFISALEKHLEDCRSFDLAIESFISINPNQDDITLRTVFVDDEKLENIRDWATMESRI